MSTEYKFLHYNQAGMIDTAEHRRLADDAAALAHGQALRGKRRVEIWAGGRRVGIVPPVTGAADG